ncbi:MAG: capsule assembly Wzi family protein [candidate division NC10 bacterium]|nr:capsule assembly Wzi family protein [candidate division NC10 bacterium]
MAFLSFSFPSFDPPAFASSNIPLGSWIYEPLERLINSGLVEEASLSTRPLSRGEVAKILAQAIGKIEKGGGPYSYQNPLLEDQLETLIEEFQWELQRMDAYPFGEKEKARWYSIKPLDTVQAKVGYAEDPYLLENAKADARAHGFNLRLGSSSRVELAEYLSLYVHPEYRYDDEQNKGYLLETYGKLTLFNIELEVGRDSLWWGPGYHGSLLLSDHALPLDLAKLSSATPFRLPWIFRYLGTFDLSLFLARLEENRDFPHAKLMGMRIDWSPFSFLELGLSRVVLFDGNGRPSYDLGDYWTVFTAREENKPGKFDNNQIASLDGTLRLRNVGRYFPLATSLVLYGEYGGEDMAGEKSGIPFPYKAGVIGGILLQDLFTLEGLDLRAEYARTDKVWYRHGVYTSGYTYKGIVLGHHMGGDADDFYFRLSHWLNKNWQIALDFDQQRQGRSQSVEIRERYVEPSVLLFRPGEIPLSVLLGYRFVDTRNAGFQRGEHHRNHLLSLEASLHF